MSFITSRLSEKRPISFDDACQKYINRYTFDNIPKWSQSVNKEGLYEAPHFSNDIEWYQNTFFPGEQNVSLDSASCISEPTFPLGEYLIVPFNKKLLNEVVAFKIDCPDGDSIILRTNDVLSALPGGEYNNRLRFNILDMSSISRKHSYIKDMLSFSGLDIKETPLELIKGYVYPDAQEAHISLSDIEKALNQKSYLLHMNYNKIG